MNAQDLRNLIEKTDDKLSLFADLDTLKKYDLNNKELLNLISDFLNEDEKIKLFDYPHFQKIGNFVKCNIIKMISNENMILQMISNDKIMNDFENYQIIDIVKKLSDDKKQQLLHNQDFIKKHQFSNYELKDFICSLTDKGRTELLKDTDLIKNKLHLEDPQITNLIKELSSEDSKNNLLDIYEIPCHQKIPIINTFSDNRKLDILLKENDFYKYDIINILKTLDINTLSDFIVEHKEFCNKNAIHPYEIINALDSNKQKDFATNIENIDLTQNEKREILVLLKEDVKQSIDQTNLKEDYKTALSINATKYGGRIVLDLERNLEDYRGLDNLLLVNPKEFTKEKRDKFMQLCDICPNLQVINTIGGGIEFNSSVQEYKETEEWISSIIDNLDPEYSKAQKMAVIDNEIGKKISYSPDFGTEVFNQNNSRALWKIASLGYGVCNGISNLEQYIFNRIGIESEIVGSGTHSFLKIKDIELPLANGETAKGNTILDPTWNLLNHRFASKPNNFCISYEQARKNDIDKDGKDHNCHKNDEKLQDATLNLDEESLRKLFTSVGLADIDGQFPIKNLIEKSKSLDKSYANQPDENISNQLLLLSQTCPEFATCQNSSMNIISNILLNNENLKFDKCVVNRVYNKADTEKKPVLFVYIDSNELEKNFYFADKEQGKFVYLPQEEFTNRFECYEKDLEKYNRT